MPTAVTADVIEAIVGPGTTRVTSRASIYEADGTTVFQEYVPIIDGSVSVDASRDERRAFDLTIENVGQRLKHPGNFSYDKIIKLWRGIVLEDGTHWERQLGEFMIDSIQTQHFPHTIAISGRDYTKKLLKDEFPTAITFTSGISLTALIKAIVLNGGITKYVIPEFGIYTNYEHSFSEGTSRWAAVREIARSYSMDPVFDSDGYFTLVPFQDPLSAPSLFTFKTGDDGTLKSYTRRTTDDRIYNHIVVTGVNPDGDEYEQLPPPYAIAENNNPDSPTSVQKIGRRTYRFTSQFMNTIEQCQRVADNFLKIHALEVYEVSLDSLVLPWLDTGYVVRFEDPQATPGSPDRFLLNDFQIPLRLGSMSCGARRVVLLSDLTTAPVPTGPAPVPGREGSLNPYASEPWRPPLTGGPG